MPVSKTVVEGSNPSTRAKKINNSCFVYLSFVYLEYNKRNDKKFFDV